MIDARKGYAGTFSAQKEELVVKALSLYEKYEEFLERKYGISKPIDNISNIGESEKVDIIDYEENVRNLIKGSEDY